jgi:hypothetical protein
VADRPVMRIPFASFTQWRVARGVRLSVAAGNDVARRTIRLWFSFFRSLCRIEYRSRS